MARHHGERGPQRPSRRDRTPPHCHLRAWTFRIRTSRYRTSRVRTSRRWIFRVRTSRRWIFRFRTFRIRSERNDLNDRGTSVTAVMPEGVALARDLVSPAIEAAIGRLTPDVRVVAAYHFG